MKKKLILLLVTGFMLFACAVPKGKEEKKETPSVSQIINIPDDELRRVIKSELGLGENDVITEADLAGITELTHEREGYICIEKIDGLQFCTNITKLQLKNHAIRDVTPLKELTSLISLDLEENKISDISPLEGLTNLEELGLGVNKIVVIDEDAFENLTKLKRLSLNSNMTYKTTENGKKEIDKQLEDITCLTPLINLEELRVDCNKIGNNGMDLTPGTPNRDLADTVIAMLANLGISVPDTAWKEGNKTE